MTVYLWPNPRKQRVLESVCAVVQKLKSCGVRVVMRSDLQPLFPAVDAEFMPQADALLCCDVIVTVGGDGTILHAALQCLDYKKPLLGVNLGRMGFLATVEVDELDKLERLAAGAYTLDRRAILTASVQGHNALTQYALNDVVLFKQGVAQTVDVRIYCDEILVNRYLGDGVVIATPTGSTAYSLSAGGPVLDARIDGLVMTPICAHSMHSPPMVFSAHRKLRIVLESPGAADAFLCCDGQAEVPIASGDSVDVSLSNRYISLVCFNEADQFEAIDKKLKGR